MEQNTRSALLCRPNGTCGLYAPLENSLTFSFGDCSLTGEQIRTAETHGQMPIVANPERLKIDGVHYITCDMHDGEHRKAQRDFPHTCGQSTREKSPIMRELHTKEHIP